MQGLTGAGWGAIMALWLVADIGKGGIIMDVVTDWLKHDGGKPRLD